MKSGKNKNRYRLKNKQGLIRSLYVILALCIIGLIAWNVYPTQASPSKYADAQTPDDWTNKTPAKIYNRNNGQWESMAYGDVGADTEFIIGNYVYATTKDGNLFLKPEIDINLLTETDQPFNPDNWRTPTADDIVFLYKSSTNQEKGHWLLKDVQPDSEVVFQGKVWKWIFDTAKQQYMIGDTGNVFARVTAVHKNVHEGDVLALTVHFEACGKIGVITGSNEHPFFVLDTEEYVKMVDLKPNMALLTDDGTPATVAKLEPINESMVMYNLTVEYVHNYFIYNDESETGVLVHNCDIDPNKLNHIFGKAQHKLDSFLDSFDGNQQGAYTAVYSKFSNIAGEYTNAQLNNGIQVIVNGYQIIVEGQIVNGVPKIGTFYIP